ncbi:MAG TPA: DUF1786 domain-containing protein [Anaerolineae bacterium]|nr:DUF1786 domain-containing protein [Anaerolineae bacterium]
MKVLAVDIGTGTQDILLYDSDREIENCLKLVMPSATMRVARQVKQATREGRPVLLTGVTMGGGPSAWATLDHVRAGYPVYATPEAARTFDDELEKVEQQGIKVIGDDEARRLDGDVIRVEMRDFDFDAIRSAFDAFGVDLQPDALALAVFDHGNAPPGYSDRQFRFDYLEARIRAQNRLSAFAFRRGDLPEHLTRLQAVEATASFDGPLMLMDTAPAAVLGALLDPKVAAHPRLLTVNVGNFHVLAFRLGSGGVEGVFEHHTGEIDLPQLDGFIDKLIDGTLQHRDVFDTMGHGALVFDPVPMPTLNGEPIFVSVTGPRRSIMRESKHKPYFAVPYGDMMIAGCFGMLRAFADVYPEHGETILSSLNGSPRGAPWDYL